MDNPFFVDEIWVTGYIYWYSGKYMDVLVGKIARMVRFHRKKAKMTQLELAKLCGVGKTVVFDIEKGKKTVRLATLLSVLYVLNITIEFRGPLMHRFEESDEKS